MEILSTIRWSFSKSVASPDPRHLCGPQRPRSIKYWNRNSTALEPTNQEYPHSRSSYHQERSVRAGGVTKQLRESKTANSHEVMGSGGSQQELEGPHEKVKGKVGQSGHNTYIG